MSLDVYLESDSYEKQCYCPYCHNVHKVNTCDCFYSANITHNLGKMAEAAGIYECLWRPEKIGITKAAQLIWPLTTGLASLNADPKKFKGWGTYNCFVMFVRDYLNACKENPEANVRVSR